MFCARGLDTSVKSYDGGGGTGTSRPNGIQPGGVGISVDLGSSITWRRGEWWHFAIWKTPHAALDYQFINDPAYNRAGGPVSVLGARLHWSFWSNPPIARMARELGSLGSQSSQFL
jgi:hypothetical protein